MGSRFAVHTAALQAESAHWGEVGDEFEAAAAAVVRLLDQVAEAGGGGVLSSAARDATAQVRTRMGEVLDQVESFSTQVSHTAQAYLAVEEGAHRALSPVGGGRP